MKASLASCLLLSVCCSDWYFSITAHPIASVRHTVKQWCMCRVYISQVQYVKLRELTKVFPSLVWLMASSPTTMTNLGELCVVGGEACMNDGEVTEEGVDAWR